MSLVPILDLNEGSPIGQHYASQLLKEEAALELERKGGKCFCPWCGQEIGEEDIKELPPGVQVAIHSCGNLLIIWLDSFPPLFPSRFKRFRD